MNEPIETLLLSTQMIPIMISPPPRTDLDICRNIVLVSTTLNRCVCASVADLETRVRERECMHAWCPEHGPWYLGIGILVSKAVVEVNSSNGCVRLAQFVLPRTLGRCVSHAPAIPANPRPTPSHGKDRRGVFCLLKSAFTQAYTCQ